jgi:hypothetical protein
MTPLCLAQTLSTPAPCRALKRIASNYVRTNIVETASRFARDLVVAEIGFRRLRDAGITLIADAPNSFFSRYANKRVHPPSTGGGLRARGR